MTSTEYRTTQIVYIVSILLVVFQVLAWNRLVSVLLMVTIVMVYLLWGLTLYTEVTNRDVMLVCLITLTALNVFINAKMAGTDLSFSYIKKLLLFAATLIFLQTVSKLRIRHELEEFVLNANTLLSVFLIAEYSIQGDKAYLINGIVTHYLTFHFTNPNLAGMYLSAIAMLEVCRGLREQKKQSMLFHFLLAGALLYLTNQTQTRNALFGTLFFFGMLLLNSMQKGTMRRMHPTIAALTILWPAIFIAIYMFIISRPVFTKYFSFLVSTGKNIDSRAVIWRGAIHYFRSSPIFGAYHQVSYGTGMSQMHNTALDIAASYGICVFLATMVFLLKIITCRNAEGISRARFHYISAFSACLIMGMGEAALFSGSLSFFVLAGLFLMLTGGGESAEDALYLNGNDNEDSILV